jgi:uncharacterized membrane protein YhaH (DUF805 family)
MNIIKEIYKANRIGRLCFIVSEAALIASFLVAGNYAIEFGVRHHIGLPFGLSFGLSFVVFIGLTLWLKVKRAHDIGWDGWSVLTTFVPVVGVGYYLFLMFKPGIDGPNVYGNGWKK